MNTELSFIVIDDGELDRYLTRKFLELTYTDVSVRSFENAQHALDIIRMTPKDDGLAQTIILLDLQMPLMNGFQFVEEFEKLPSEVQKNYKVIVQTVLTSKNDPDDISAILAYKAVNSVIQKPLSKEKLVSLLEQLRSEVN
jgi:CheY-like chemotaxis protein